MNIRVRLVLVSFLFLVVFQCGNVKDPKVVMNEYMDVSEGYLNDLDGAGSVGDVCHAINTFAEQMDGLVPRMKVLMEKYPELRGMRGELPRGFEDYRKRYDELMSRMQGSHPKIKHYGSNPAVQESMMNMMKVMKKMMR